MHVVADSTKRSRRIQPALPPHYRRLQAPGRVCVCCGFVVAVLPEACLSHGRRAQKGGCLLVTMVLGPPLPDAIR
jgi:hypothetical protein